MAGFTPNEGETLCNNLLYKNADVDRGTNLQLVLFTNAAPGETITAATLTQPTGTGYAPISLVDGTWNVTNDVASYAQQTFTGGVGGWTGAIQGYAILTTGTTPRILDIEVDSVNAPLTINENDTYKITPSITFS